MYKGIKEIKAVSGRSTIETLELVNGWLSKGWTIVEIYDNGLNVLIGRTNDVTPTTVGFSDALDLPVSRYTDYWSEENMTKVLGYRLPTTPIDMSVETLDSRFRNLHRNAIGRYHLSDMELSESIAKQLSCVFRNDTSNSGALVNDLLDKISIILGNNASSSNVNDAIVKLLRRYNVKG